MHQVHRWLKIPDHHFLNNLQHNQRRNIYQYNGRFHLLWQAAAMDICHLFPGQID